MKSIKLPYLSVLLACAGLANAAEKEFLPTPPDGIKWKLAWSDEFEGAALDETKWTRQGDERRRDGFWVKEDAYLDGKGHLVLRTKKDGDRYTSGSVWTKDKFEHAFGYYVARCKWPKEPGHWPAFWLMCNGVSKIGNDGRDGTEIDVVEVPWRTGQLTCNLHWDGYGKEHKSSGKKFTIPEAMNGWHTYGLLWTTNEYVFYVDDQEVWRSSDGGVSQVPEYLWLSEEIGKWGGDIKEAKLPDYTEVDYVRVYDYVSASGPASEKGTVSR